MSVVSVVVGFDRMANAASDIMRIDKLWLAFCFGVLLCRYIPVCSDISQMSEVVKSGRYRDGNPGRFVFLRGFIYS